MEAFRKRDAFLLRENMMEQRFTKGKWRFSRYGGLEAHDNGKMVDTIMFVPQDEQLIEDDTTLIVINNIQDKRLIQAAPEMYTLLESILMMPVTGNIRSMKKEIRAILSIADIGHVAY